VDGTDYLEDAVEGGRLIIKIILRKYFVRM
jgi:hypothetical protein